MPCRRWKYATEEEAEAARTERWNRWFERKAATDPEWLARRLAQARLRAPRYYPPRKAAGERRKPGPRPTYATVEERKAAERETGRRYRERHRAKLNERALASYHLHRGFDFDATLRQQQGRCAYCNEPLLRWEVDHVIPVSRGGADTPDNLALACSRCNNQKRAKTPVEYLAWLTTRTARR